jgi:Fungal Zn(2)-Cys(6) binuclear cluster domain.
VDLISAHADGAESPHDSGVRSSGITPSRPSALISSPSSGLSPRTQDHVCRRSVRIKCLRLVAGTACWPCRQRKVKCDNKSPCENCVKREHPQLCSYKPNRTSTGKNLSVSSDHSTPNRKRARSPDVSELRRSQSNDARDAIAYGG